MDIMQSITNSRTYNPERMRKERWAKTQAGLKKWGLGAIILYDYDFHRYMGYYTFHQYARRRLGTYVLVVQGEEVTYVNTDKYPNQWKKPCPDARSETIQLAYKQIA